MDKFILIQFYTLVRRELWENRNLFIGAPAVLAFLLFVAVALFSPKDQLLVAVESMAIRFDGFTMKQLASIFVVFTVPLTVSFIVMLFVCCLVYLVNALYQDRKDMSIFFWQSMPISNLKTVLSKVFIVTVIAPFFYVSSIFILYLVGMVWLSILAVMNGVGVAGIWWLFLGLVTSLLLVYLSVLSATLWLFPTVGWILLFSAFARKTPLLWAIGVFVLVGFLEGFLFGSQYLGNWVESRAVNINQYLIMSFDGVLERLFSYDMLFGIFMGSILMAGAVMMRRFTD